MSTMANLYFIHMWFLSPLSLLYHTHTWYSPFLILYPIAGDSFYGYILRLLYWEVSWCSWLSHHFYVVRVPGSNPGGTIFNAILIITIQIHTWPETYGVDYPFLPLSLVGSYQVGYTRSHLNTEVKMLRACSVPLCSHRRERQVIYLFVFFISIHR